MSELTHRLTAAVLAGPAGPVEPGLMPGVLSTACADVLDVDGAGLSLIGDLRVPLAASSSDVRRAEQLQTTLGEGPCLSADATGQALAAGSAQMMQGWPVFHQELTRQTALRSVVSLPLLTPRTPPFGALDLYFTGHHPDRSLLVDPTRGDLVHLVTSFLSSSSLIDLLDDPRPGADAAARGAGAAVAERLNVWTAIGVVTSSTGMSQPTALARLRAHAFRHDATLEHVAHLVTSRRLSITT